MTGRLASTRSPGLRWRRAGPIERGIPYGARNERAVARRAAAADTPTLVANSCQKAGSTTLTSARWSSDGTTTHDGGDVLLFGSIPIAANAVQTIGSSTMAMPAP